MKKPNALEIRASAPLSIIPVSADRMACCNVCSKPAEALYAYRAHDERDEPIAGDRAIVFLGAGDAHADCHKRLRKHPRLFDEAGEAPGRFPALCGPCVHRDGLACRHPDLKTNGGAGLRIELAGVGGIVCGRGGCRPLYPRAVGCTGRRTLALVEATE